MRQHLLVYTFLFTLAVVFKALGQEPSYQFEANVMIPMRDKTKLAANIFRPRAEGRYPVILMRSPYGKPGSEWGEAKRYTSAGYVMVVQDCRGRGNSEGPWDPFRYDPEDGFDTQEWIGQQPWCNGEIGTLGGSYVGWTQWASAPNASRYLKCMVPVVPFGNVYHDIAYPGGAFQLSLLMGWGSSVAGVSLTPDKMQQAFKHLPLNTFSGQFEKKVSYLDDWVSHSSYDQYWEKRSIGTNYTRIKVPVLNIGGWYDIFSKTTLDLVGHVRESSENRAMRRNQFVIMGPWAHGVDVRKVGDLDFGDQAQINLGELQFQWMEYWLKGKETGVQSWPAYRIFVMGENRWRDEHEWPLKRTQFTPMYLTSKGRANTLKGDGGLTFEKSTSIAKDTFRFDPNNPVPSHGGNNLVGATAGPLDQTSIEQRDDVLVYTSSPLERPAEVTGPVKMVLYAASTALDTDFTAKLVDVHPDGKAYNLCDGIVRARFRHGLEKPKLLEPGKVEKYEIDLWVTSNLFKEGHRIRVEVSSSNFPRFDRNPNTGKPFGTDTDLKVATQTIYHDAELPSHILLPIIPR